MQKAIDLQLHYVVDQPKVGECHYFKTAYCGEKAQ